MSNVSLISSFKTKHSKTLIVNNCHTQTTDPDLDVQDLERETGVVILQQ